MKRLVSSISLRLGSRSQRALESGWRRKTAAIQRAARLRQFDRIESHLGEARSWIDERAAEIPELHIKLMELADLYQSLAGDNSTAEALYRMSLDSAEKKCGADSLESALARNSLALFLIQQRQVDEAEQLLRKTLPAVEAHFGPDHPEVASCLENLAAALRQKGLQSEAAEFRKRASLIRRHSHGDH